MYHREPLIPGQTFSFVESRELALTEDAYGRVYASPGLFGEPVLTVLPAARMIVYGAAFIPGGMWEVYSELHSSHRLQFLQRCGTEELALLAGGSGGALEPGREPYQKKHGWAVTEVGWPDPSPRSLAIQVRVLSCYEHPFRPRRNSHGQRPPIPRRQCHYLQEVELEQGVELALEWLKPYQKDPAGALRERGFAV